MLPALETFAAFSLAIGLYLVPVGFALAAAASLRRRPCLPPWSSVSCRCSRPTNQMSYDTAQFYNFALAIVAGAAPRRFRFACCRRCRRRFGPAGCWR